MGGAEGEKSESKEGEEGGKEAEKSGGEKGGTKAVAEKPKECICYESKPKDHPECFGYEIAGFVCKGDTCAACNPSGDPDKCAKKAAKGTFANPKTGKCEKGEPSASAEFKA